LAAGEKCAAKSAATQKFLHHLPLFHPQLRNPFRRILLREAARIFEDAPLAAVRSFRAVGRAQQVCGGRLESEIVDGVLTGDHVLLDAAGGESVLLQPGRRRSNVDTLAARTTLERG